jgi:hypothetical protein
MFRKDGQYSQELRDGTWLARRQMLNLWAPAAAQ